MPETHLFQHLAMLILSLWWTKQWLISRPVSRWRFAISGLVGAIAWIYVAFTATGSVAASSGVEILYGSQALAYFSAFMAFISGVGILIGLLLWTEEEIEKASENLPQTVQSNLGGD